MTPACLPSGAHDTMREFMPYAAPLSTWSPVDRWPEICSMVLHRPGTPDAEVHRYPELVAIAIPAVLKIFHFRNARRFASYMTGKVGGARPGSRNGRLEIRCRIAIARLCVFEADCDRFTATSGDSKRMYVRSVDSAVPNIVPEVALLAQIVARRARWEFEVNRCFGAECSFGKPHSRRRRVIWREEHAIPILAQDVGFETTRRRTRHRRDVFVDDRFDEIVERVEVRAIATRALLAQLDTNGVSART